jgi:hypothetical protein
MGASPRRRPYRQRLLPLRLAGAVDIVEGIVLQEDQIEAQQRALRNEVRPRHAMLARDLRHLQDLIAAVQKRDHPVHLVAPVGTCLLSEPDATLSTKPQAMAYRSATSWLRTMLRRQVCRGKLKGSDACSTSWALA